MKLPQYQLKAEKSLLVFEFISEGPKGQIPKLIKFSETNLKGLFNLAFGDKDKLTGEINDLVISNNGDSENYNNRSENNGNKNRYNGNSNGNSNSDANNND